MGLVQVASSLKCSFPRILDERGYTDSTERWRLIQRAAALNEGFAEAERDWHQKEKAKTS